MKQMLLSLAVITLASEIFAMASQTEFSEPKPLPVALVGLLDWQETSLRRAMKSAPFKVDILDPTKPTDLTKYKFVLLERGVFRTMHQWRVSFAQAYNKGTKFVLLLPSAAEGMAGLPIEKPDEFLLGYFAQPSVENMKRFLVYAAAKLAGESGEILPPFKAPENAIYHPDAPELFADLKSYADWRKLDENKPNIVIVFSEASYFSGNTEVVDELIRRLEQHSNVIATYGRLPKGFEPDAIITLQPHGNARRLMNEISAPTLQGVQLMDMNFDDWSNGSGIKGGVTMAIWILQPELQGHIEPIVVAYRERTPEGFVMKPIPERISKLAQRALAWAKLKRKQNSEKRIAIVHYAMGAAYLDVPKSLFKLLKALKERGYHVELPESEAQLLEMLKSARYPENLTDSEILSQISRSSNFVSVDATEYRSWFELLPEKIKHQVVKWWGEPLGNLMVYDGKIWLPCVRLGNIAILPLPPRADPNREDALYHSLDVPPTHLYLAFYWWLKKGWQSDAIIHFGTHGTLEFTPTKQAGLSETDFPDLLLFDTPNIYPYMVNNPIEAITARRRGYAVTISHDVPPVRKTKLTPNLQRIAKLLEGYKQAETESLKAEYRRQIAKLLKPQAKTLPVSLQPKAKLDDDYLESLYDWLHELQHQEAPIGLHVFGDKPDSERLKTAAVAAFRETLAKALQKSKTQQALNHQAVDGSNEAIKNIKGENANRNSKLAANAIQTQSFSGSDNANLLAESIICRLAEGQGIEQVATEFDLKLDEELSSLLKRVSLMVERMSQNDELGSLLRALEGQLPISKVGGEPIRNIETLPTGNQIHGLDPDAIPSRAAWELGKRLASEMLENYRKENGRYPKRIGYVLFGSETIRHQGVMESQILWLLGVEPVWDNAERVVGLKLIPAEQLGRPRIDVVVTVTGQYRDIFGDVMKRLQTAVELAANASDGENFVKETTEELRKKLEREEKPEEASNKSLLRIFAPPAGVYGAIEQAAPKAKDPQKLANLYIERVGFAYGQDKNWGTQQRQVFEDLLKGVEVSVFSRTGRLYGLLDTDHPFAWLGGMNLAVKQLSGKSPKLVIANMQSNLPEQAKMESAQKFMNREALSRYLNPEWLRGMMAHNFAGAKEMAGWLENLWGWQLTASEIVDENLWQQAYEVYVRDQFRLGIVDWLRQVNPEALESIAKRLLQAAEAGAWKATPSARLELIALLQGQNPKEIEPTKQIALANLMPTKTAERASKQVRWTKFVKPSMPKPLKVTKSTVDKLVAGIKLSETPISVPSPTPSPNLPLGLPLLSLALFFIGVRKGFRL
ncbi:MAG: cobaltochelatase subunit CobN [Armatimonadetes bacterium]|nr:cobaltochelatase subunit CobN [Armatimonadota bacterium]MDW8027354.1 cobaltochelatase subunit CobN [Armatimonadota bacterium]